MPISRHDVLGGQGNNVGLPVADDDRGNGGVIIEGLAIGELAGETVVAMQSFGREGVDTIQSHQELVVKIAKIDQHAVLFQTLKNVKKDRIK